MTGADRLGAVVLSDLHLGERNGLLTDERDGRPQAGEVLEAFAAALRPLVASLAGTRAPSLVINGDGIELALAPRHVALDAFDQFVAHVLAPGHPFADDIGWLPGNHDHTLWPSAREALDLERLHGDEGPPLAASPPATVLLAGLGALAADGAPPAVRSPLLTGLLRARHPHLAGGSVQVVYPNLGLLQDDRLLVLHHGHLADRFCTLMSPMAQRLSGADPMTVEPGDLEEDNGAWINFLWSSLGEEGRSGATLKRIYDLMHTETGRVVLGNQVSRGIVGDGPGLGGRVGRALIRPAVIAAVQAAKGVGHARQVEDPRPQDDRHLLAYLGGPLRRQVRREFAERGLRAPRRHGFVFGHTHQPFCDELWGDEARVDAVNTGGWVVDSDEPRPRTGAAVALVGGALDVALVRIIQQTEDPLTSELRVQAPPQSSPAFVDAVRACVADHDREWQQLREALAATIVRRRATLAAEIARERAELGRRGLRLGSFDRQVAEARRWAQRRLDR